MTAGEVDSTRVDRRVHDRRNVIIVDANDRPIGSIPKLDAHRAPGILHRAFSIFVFDPAGRILLQRRALTKYHFAGRWTNSCCSHPGPGQETVASAKLRLDDEMGLRDVDLIDVGGFLYSALDRESGLVEHEFDHVLIGTTTEQPEPHPAECADHRWIAPDDLHRLIDERPTFVTPWLNTAFHIAVRAAGGPTT